MNKDNKNRYYRQQRKNRFENQEKSKARKKKLLDALKKLEDAKKDVPQITIKTKDLKSDKSIKKKVGREVKKAQKVRRIRNKREKLSKFFDLSFISDTKIDKISLKDIESENFDKDKYAFLYESKDRRINYNTVYHTKKAFIFAYRDFKNENDIGGLLKRYSGKSTKELLSMLQWIVHKPLTAIHGKTGTSGGAAGECVIYCCEPKKADIYVQDIIKKNNKGKKAYDAFGKLMKHRQHSDFYAEFQFLKSGGSVAIQDFTIKNLLVFANAIMYNVTELDRISFYNDFYKDMVREIPDLKSVLPKPQFFGEDI